jgi:AsmA protein
MKLLLKILGGVAAVLVLALIALNMLISTDAVRDRVAARIKEQSGRDLKVNGSTSLLFLPNPQIVITDASITDPSDRSGATDLTIAQLELDVGFLELLSHEVDAKRVVMVRPVFTVRLNADGNPDPQSSGDGRQGSLERRPERHAATSAPMRFIAAAADAGVPQHELRLEDVEIEDGTVRILYDERGTERRIEHIDAALSLPHLTDPLTAKGQLDWKSTPVDFDLTLTSPADLRNARQAKLELALTTKAIEAKFEGQVATKPSFIAEGELNAKSQSLPSLLAWTREKSDSTAALGRGDLASHVTWKPGEISFSKARFALAHASGQGQAVVTLKAPRPYVRAALALDQLDLGAFLPPSSGRQTAVSSPSQNSEPPPANDQAPQADSSPVPTANGDAGRVAPEPSAGPVSPDPSDAGAAPPPTPQVAAVAQPAAFDADVNLNIHQTNYGQLTIGPSSIGLGLKEGLLKVTLGGMELYGGQGRGTLVVDATQAIPSFSGDFELDNVAAKSFLTDAAQFSMLSGQTKVKLQIKGAGTTSDEIKTSLTGNGSVACESGAIEGIDLTAMIKSIGAGEMPDLKQGPGAKTEFSELGASFTIASGLARSTDLEMTSPLLKVTGRGTVDIVLGNIDVTAQPQIVAGPQGKGGANDLAGLTIPVRIEGPLAHPTIKPELKGLFSSPEQANKTIKQIGDVLQKKFKGKPVGEAIGRLLGGVQTGPKHAESGDTPPADDGTAPQAGKKQKPEAGGAPKAGAAPQDDAAPEGDKAEPEEEEQDPDLKEILR